MVYRIRTLKNKYGVYLEFRPQVRQNGQWQDISTHSSRHLTCVRCTTEQYARAYLKREHDVEPIEVFIQEV